MHEEGREEEGQVDVSDYRRKKTSIIEWHQTKQPLIFEGEIKEVDGWNCGNSIIDLFDRFSFVGQNSRPSQVDETVASTLWKQKSSIDFEIKRCLHKFLISRLRAVFQFDLSYSQDSCEESEGQGTCREGSPEIVEMK